MVIWHVTPNYFSNTETSGWFFFLWFSKIYQKQDKNIEILFQNNRYSSIPEGDKEKVSEFTTTATYYYQPHIGNFQPETGIDPYTKLYSTTFTLKDRHGTYDKYKTTTDDSFPPLPYMGKNLPFAAVALYL